MAIDVQAARAEALFVSSLQASDKPTGQQIHFTIGKVARTHGCRRVAALVAQEFGDHPDTAPARMAWSRYMVAVVYPPRHRHTKPYPWCQRCWYTPERVTEIHAKARKAMAASRDEPPQPSMTLAETLAALDAHTQRSWQ